MLYYLYEDDFEYESFLDRNIIIACLDKNYPFTVCRHKCNWDNLHVVIMDEKSGFYRDAEINVNLNRIKVVLDLREVLIDKRINNIVSFHGIVYIKK